MRLEEHPFFEHVSDDQVGELAHKAQIEEYPPHSLIFEEGSKSDGLYIVLQGRVAFKKRLGEQTYRTISHSREGDFFGEIGLFTNQPRALRAESDEFVKLAKIPSRHLVEFIKSTRGPIENILKSIINHLQATTEHYVTDLLQKEKIALVGGMTNTIIHDFKNPFCLISLAAQLIAQLHDDPKTQKLCKNIESQIQRMLLMAEELAEFSKGQQILQFHRVNLRGLMNRFRELNFPYFQSLTVRINIKVPDIEFIAEENKLLRVLQNLIGNAIDAFDDENGTINISALEEGSYVVLSINDDAKGIPKAIRDTFFDPFVTFDKDKGTGLGTAIVKSIVEAHKGSINFITAEGEGTTFTIKLPKNPESEFLQ